MTSSEIGLHSGEGTVGFGMVGDLFVHLAFEDFRKAGQYGYRCLTANHPSPLLHGTARAPMVDFWTFCTSVKKGWKINSDVLKEIV